MPKASLSPAVPPRTRPLARLALTAALGAMVAASPAMAQRQSRRTETPPPPPSEKCVSEREVVAAQRAWGEGIVEIGKVFSSGGDYKAAAAAHIDRFYGYDLSLVLFKPTLAANDQFRTSFDSALSYFVGGNPSFAEDKGFAIKPWTNVRWKNDGIVNNSCAMAVAMGNYWFTPADGTPDVKVEYTFAYVRDANDALKIVVHHSSVPFAAQ